MQMKTDMGNVTVTKVRDAKRGTAAVYVVHLGTDLIGLLERFSSHRDIHPWKAYGETGTEAVYLGAFYDDKESSLIPGDEETNFGGWRRAVENIVKYHSLKDEDTATIERTLAGMRADLPAARGSAHASLMQAISVLAVALKKRGVVSAPSR